jgi:hypothetical protein
VEVGAHNGGGLEQHAEADGLEPGLVGGSDEHWDKTGSACRVPLKRSMNLRNRATTLITRDTNHHQMIIYVRVVKLNESD